jgi:IclR family KDG regulon transcriptional repressor
MPKEKDVDNSLSKAIRILFAFSETQPKMRLVDISKQLNLHMSTTHRLLSMLVEQGLVETESDTNQYKLGICFLELAKVVLNSLPIRQRARPYLNLLAQQLKTNATLAIFDGTEVFYLDRVPPPGMPDYYVHSGRKEPVHSTALGKALLAWRDPEEVVAILERSGMPQKTERTITDPSQFLKELESVRELGFAQDHGEVISQVFCIAAPIRDSSGAVVAAISCSSRGGPIDFENLLDKTDLLLDTAHRLSFEMGYGLCLG